MSAIDTSLRVPDSFYRWLKRSREHWSIPSIGIGLPTILAFLIISLWPSLLGWDLLRVYLMGFQAVVIAVFLRKIPHPLRDVRIAERPSLAVEQFHRAWQWLWGFWMILYVGLTAQEFWLTSVKERAHGIVLENFLNNSLIWSLSLISVNLLNNLQTLALIICYLVVSKKTVQLRPAETPWSRAAKILCVVTAAEIILTLGVNKIWGVELATVPKVFTWLSGLGAGVAMALLIGRLDNKVINLPVGVVVLLYTYAVIQFTWSTFPQNHTAKILFVVVALFLKTLLFLLVAWLLKSGVLLYYFNRLGELEKEETGRRMNEFLSKLLSRGQDAITNPEPEGVRAAGDINMDKNHAYGPARSRYFSELSPDEQSSFLKIRDEHLRAIQREIYPNENQGAGSKPSDYKRFFLTLPFLLRLIFLCVGVIVYAFFVGGTPESSLGRVTIYVAIVFSLELLSRVLALRSHRLKREAMQLRIKEHSYLKEHHLP